MTGQKGMAGITVLRLATRVGVGVGFSDESQRFTLREGRLTHRDTFTRWPMCLPTAPPTDTPGRWRAGLRWPLVNCPKPTVKAESCCVPWASATRVNSTSNGCGRRAAAAATRNGRWCRSASSKAASCSM